MTLRHDCALSDADCERALLVFPNLEPVLRASAPGPLDRLRAILRVWHRRGADRVRLATLSDRLLDDIGLSREQALAEARKPFWR